MRLSLYPPYWNIIGACFCKGIFGTWCNFVDLWSRLITIEWGTSHCSIFCTILCKWDILVSSTTFFDTFTFPASCNLFVGINFEPRMNFLNQAFELLKSSLVTAGVAFDKCLWITIANLIWPPLKQTDFR